VILELEVEVSLPEDLDEFARHPASVRFLARDDQVRDLGS
jgi:hypothetical protein